MVGKPLLYGLGGEVLAAEETVKAEVRDILVEAFGFTTGLTVARATSPAQVEVLMDQARVKIVQGVLALGAEIMPAIKERFGVEVTIDPRTGELVVHSDEPLPTPPGPPRKRTPGGMYR